MSIDYDPFSEQVIQDPYPFYAQLREESPCHHLEKWDAYALSRFEGVWEACQSPVVSSASGTTTAHLLTQVLPVLPMLNLMDPPQHTDLRTQVRRYLQPANVRRIEPEIRAAVERYLSEKLALNIR